MSFCGCQCWRRGWLPDLPELKPIWRCHDDPKSGQAHGAFDRFSSSNCQWSMMEVDGSSGSKWCTPQNGHGTDANWLTHHHIWTAKLNNPWYIRQCSLCNHAWYMYRTTPCKCFLGVGLAFPVFPQPFLRNLRSGIKQGPFLGFCCPLIYPSFYPVGWCQPSHLAGILLARHRCVLEEWNTHQTRETSDGLTV